MKMQIKSTSLAAFLVGVTLAGCEGQRPEIDQIAQSSLIGLSKNKILSCLGSPTHRERVGLEEIWNFSIGHTRTVGGPLAWGLNDAASPFAPSQQCNVNIVIDSYGVSQVSYSLSDGHKLPLGQQCIYEISPCVGR